MKSKTDRDNATLPISSDSASPDAKSSPEEGETPELLLKGRYLIEKELGRGGIGAVYLARDKALHSKPVVIKVLLEESLENEWIRKKFYQEIEALSRIDHPGIIGVLDVGELSDGKPFLVMQFVEGRGLRQLIEPDGMELRRVALIMRQIGQSLTAAHDKGILHCDLKPENIMVQELEEGEELIKIIDFGIAKVRDSQVASKNTTRVAGTVDYMAPEQLEGNPSASSDIFAIGIIAYEMVTGQTPFGPVSQYQMLDAQRAGVKAMPKDLRPDLPEAAQEAILKALAFEPEARYLRARDFTEALANALTLQQTSADSGPRKVSDATRLPALEIAHVLFMDIVGYSKLPMDEQARSLSQLNEIARNASEFRRMQASDQLLRLPTGDGMALVFFRDPVAPVRCALEVADALRGCPEIKLRMGVHTGPVYHVADINANKNVSGGGINIAQRVMDCGDAGHILLSKDNADILNQIGGWGEHLHDLGECEVKHGVKVHLFNLLKGDLGKSELPSRLCSNAHAPEKPKDRSGKLLPVKNTWERIPVLVLIIIVVLIAAGAIAGIYWPKPNPPLPERQLIYWVTVERDPARYPDSKPFRLPGEIIFGDGDLIQLSVTSPQPGHLYVINEGPEGSGELPFNMLFPSPTANNGSEMLAANQITLIPEQRPFVFDKQTGTEKLWFIWSAQNIPDFDAAKRWVNEQDRGEVKDPNQIKAIRDFLTGHSAAKPAMEKDEVGKLTNVKGSGDVLVHLVKLEHR